MKSFTNLLFVMCMYHHCIGDEASWYKLLNGSITDVETRCTKEWNGNITVFRDYSSIGLSQIFDKNDKIRIWNGYRYTSDWVENTGCFNKIQPLKEVHNAKMADMTISYCEHFCKRFGQFDLAIKETECLCVPQTWNNPYIFISSNVNRCTNKCIMRPYEICGSNVTSTFYNIYSVQNFKTSEYPRIAGDESCLVYKERSLNKPLEATDCDEKLTSKYIKCRSKEYTPVIVSLSNSTWTSAMNACIRSYQSRSYLVSRSDKENDILFIGRIWLNERKYTTTVEKMNDDEQLQICEILSKDSTGYVSHELIKCRNSSGLHYVCKTGFISNGPGTSTPTYQQNVSSDMRSFPLGDPNNSDGSLIGGVIGALVVVTVIAGIIVVFVRKRPPGSCKEESQYQSQKVKFSKSNGITNNGYCSEAIIDIIQGNPDRNSQENYMTIKDEDLQTLRNAKSEASKSADQNTSSLSDGPLYMVLEETKSVSEIAASIPNYELAKHIPNSESGGKENCEHDEENVEYDHLRQDAYIQAQEDAHPPADIADDYSHISQVTNVTEDNYTHTENYMHTCTPRNEEEEDAYAHAQNSDYDRMVSEGDARNSNPYDFAENVDNLQYDSTECKTDRNEEEEDAYAHAQKKDYDSMVSEDDTRNSNPYDLAENVDNLQYDSTECKTDSFVQLDADNGNYSFAKPVDVSDGT